MVFAPSGDRTDDPPRSASTSRTPAGRRARVRSSSFRSPPPSRSSRTSPPRSSPRSTWARSVRPARSLRDHLRAVDQPAPDQRRRGRGDRQRHHALPGSERLGAEPHGAEPRAHREHLERPPEVVVPVTNEPAGAGFNPSNGHYYFSADDGKKVFDVNPGRTGSSAPPGTPSRRSTRSPPETAIPKESPTARSVAICSSPTASTGRSTSTRRRGRS